MGSTDNFQVAGDSGGVGLLGRWIDILLIANCLLVRLFSDPLTSFADRISIGQANQFVVLVHRYKVIDDPPLVFPEPRLQLPQRGRMKWGGRNSRSVCE